MSNVHAMPVMLLVLAILAVAYRYYSAFLAAKVATLDDSRVTPAHEFHDGQNFHPTNRWVLFGHHFAAISGAGPLIGPVLAIQFGYVPGLIWLVVGVCLAGRRAGHDGPRRRRFATGGSMSLAGIARDGDRPGRGDRHGHLAILYVIIIALAGPGDRRRQGARRRRGRHEGGDDSLVLPRRRLDQQDQSRPGSTTAVL